MTPAQQLEQQILQLAEAKAHGWMAYRWQEKNKLRWLQRGDSLVLQQLFLIYWKLPDKEWRTFIGYVKDDTTEAWLDVPMVQQPERAAAQGEGAK